MAAYSKWIFLLIVARACVVSIVRDQLIFYLPVLFSMVLLLWMSDSWCVCVTVIPRLCMIFNLTTLSVLVVWKTVLPFVISVLSAFRLVLPLMLTVVLIAILVSSVVMTTVAIVRGPIAFVWAYVMSVTGPRSISSFFALVVRRILIFPVLLPTTWLKAIIFILFKVQLRPVSYLLCSVTPKLRYVSLIVIYFLRQLWFYW